jgi:hypothetical protein
MDPFGLLFIEWFVTFCDRPRVCEVLPGRLRTAETGMHPCSRRRASIGTNSTGNRLQRELDDIGEKHNSALSTRAPSDVGPVREYGCWLEGPKRKKRAYLESNSVNGMRTTEFRPA